MVAVEFDYSGSYLAVGGSDIRYLQSEHEHSYADYFAKHLSISQAGFSGFI